MVWKKPFGAFVKKNIGLKSFIKCFASDIVVSILAVNSQDQYLLIYLVVCVYVYIYIYIYIYIYMHT